jgi:hypothetical protein
MVNNPVKTIIITGVLIRVLLIIIYRHITFYPDSEDYIQLAERILDFNLSNYEGQRSPGYPALLAISGISYTITIILQVGIGIVSLILIYKTCILAGISNRLSLIITLVLACYIPAAFFELALLSETLTLFFVLLTVYLFLNIRTKKLKYYILLSLSCGYLVLIKPFYIFLPAILFIILLFSNHRTKHLFRKTIIILVPAIFFLGWSYVNKINTGYFTSTTFYGFNLAQNCVGFAEKTTPEYAEIGRIYAKYRDNRTSDKEIAMTIWEAYPELEKETGLSFPDLSKKLYDYSISTIQENPAAYLKQVLISWRDFWKTSLYRENDRFAATYANDVIRCVCYVERIVLQLVKILFVLLIPYNITQSIRKKKFPPQTLISIVVITASVLQALITYGTNSRFSFPFEALMVISVVLNLMDRRNWSFATLNKKIEIENIKQETTSA